MKTKIKTKMMQLGCVLLLFFQLPLLMAQCPQFSNYEYNKLVINSDWITCRENFLTKNIVIQFPTNQLTDEITGDLGFLEVNLGDGFEFVSDNLEVAKNYESPGIKTISVRACSDEPETGCFHSEIYKINIKPTSEDYESPDLIIDLEAANGMTWTLPDGCSPYADDSDGYLGSTIGGGKAYVKYATGNTQITKPMIFVDGIDFKTEEKRVRDHTFDGGGIIRYGSIGWDVIVTGSSEGFKSPHENYPTSEFDLYPTAFKELRNNGYDIVFVDFERGADYIQKNGIVLMDAINKINE